MIDAAEIQKEMAEEIKKRTAVAVVAELTKIATEQNVRLRRLDEVDCMLQRVTGYSSHELLGKFMAGYTLEPPKYDDWRESIHVIEELAGKDLTDEV